jgi:hypothetical protein
VSLALAKLPRTLNDAYERIISQIEDQYYEDASRILQWLMHSRRKMRLEEVAEVLTVTLDDHEPRFEVANRLYRARSILNICSSLIYISKSETLGSEEVGLAHFSVAEFLTRTGVPGIKQYDRRRWSSSNSSRDPSMDRIGDHPFKFTSSEAHMLIAESCIVYLNAITDTAWERVDIIANFPPAEYAAEFWTIHAFSAMPFQYSNTRLTNLATQLLTKDNDAFENWVYLYDIEKPWLQHSRDNAKGVKCDPRPLSPLYLCCLAGLPDLVKEILRRGDDPNEVDGIFGTPLQAASFMGVLSQC